MEIFIKIAQFLLSLSILVILHEMGHFFFAKLFKTRVEKFYLFFNPWFSLLKFKKGETEYGVGWLPLGGYVKISGMIDESMDVEQMKQPPQPHEFRSKPSWQRLLIMIGGVLVNFLLALVIYSMVLYVWGEEYLPTQNVKYGVSCDSLALQTGLRNGDKIISIDNQKIENFRDILPDIVLNNSKSIQVDRNGEIVNIPIDESLVPALLKNPKEFVQPRFPFYVNEFVKDSPAKDAGFQKGDKLVGIDSVKTEYFDDFRTEIIKNKNKEVNVSLLRNDSLMTLKVKVPESGLLGIYPIGDMSKFFELRRIEYSFFESIPAGIDKGISTLSDYIKQFKLIFTPKTKAYESLGGFITIGKIFPGVWDWQSFWTLTAFLSIILAFMNILPIPALDGGHVMFLLYEMITGRKPGDKFLEYAQIVGLVLLFSLLLYANLNDVFRLFKD
jgi:regulator of sigma E protease